MSEFPAAGPAGAPGGQERRSAAQQPGQEVPASVRGAVDLGAAGTRAAGTGQQDGAGYRVSITTETFQNYAEESARVPVVVVLHAAQSPESQGFVETVASVVDGYAGKLLLGTVDVSEEPQIAQAFQAQTVPTVLALLGGRVVPLVTSTVPAEQLRQLFDELLVLAEQNGVTGTAQPTGPVEAPPLPPLHQEALDRLETGDLDGAQAAYRKALAENPGDRDAKLALTQVQLLQRVNALDARAVREAAAQDPADVGAALEVADLDVSGGHVEDAFRRLLDLVRTTAGEEKERVRSRLVELFDVVGSEDPRVVAARAQLMRALF